MARGRGRGNRGGKKGGWAAAGGANKDKKGSKGTPTNYKQKAFGANKLIDRVFRESNVVRDASGKFTEKPGKGKPPTAKLLDGHRPDDNEKKKFKIIEDVTKSIRQRQKAAKELQEYRLQVAQQKIDAEVNSKIEAAAASIASPNSKTTKSLRELIDINATPDKILKDYDKNKNEYTDRQVESYTKGLIEEGIDDATIEERVTKFKQGILKVQHDSPDAEIKGLLETISLAEGIADTPAKLLKEFSRLNDELNEGVGTRAMAMDDGEEAIREEYILYQAREARRKALAGIKSDELDTNRDTSREAVSKRKSATSEAYARKNTLSAQQKEAQKAYTSDKSPENKKKLEEAKKAYSDAVKEYKDLKKESDKDRKSTEIQARGYKNIEEARKDGEITDTTKRARTSTPSTEESIATRMSELEEVFGRETLSALMENMDVLSIVPQSINSLQSNLITTLYDFQQKNGTYKNPDIISWKNLIEGMSADEIESLVKGWSKRQNIKRYTGSSKWQAKKATEGSIHTSDKRQAAGEKLVEKWKQEGNYERKRKGEDTETVEKIHDYVLQGMRKNIQNAIDKGVEEAYAQAERQGKELSEADKKQININARRAALDKLIGMEELLQEDSDLESYAGRSIVNPATEIPREVIEVLPDGALAYLINKFSNHVGRKVKTSVVYNEFLHGASENKVTQETSSRFKYETHHIEQFMYRTESGEPIIVYDSMKKGGKVRNMIHSDMDNLYSEEINGERVYYVKSQKRNGEEVRSYLGRSPYDDESDVEIAEDGRVMKSGKPSISRVKEELGTNEPYIDLRGSTHQNKDFLYSMLHPGTTVRNDDAFKNQVATLDKIAQSRGDSPVSKYYKDDSVGFHSIGVGMEERKAHEKIKGKLEAIRKHETLQELREEMERRRAKNPEGVAEQEVLAKYGHASRLRDSEEKNVKSTGNKVEELKRLQAAYSAFGADSETMTKIHKALDKAVKQNKKAQDRYNDVKGITEDIEKNHKDLLDKKYNPNIHSEKFLETAMYEANTWNISIEGEATRTRLREAIIKNNGQTKDDPK